MEKKLTTDNCKSALNNVPPVVQDYLSLTEKNFAKDYIIIDAHNTGMGRPTRYNRAYCDHCHKNLVAEVLTHEFFTEFEFPFLKDLIDNCEDLKLSATDIDLVGCLVPLCKKVSAGPRAWHFLVRPIEHPQTAHPYTSAESKDSSASVKKNAKAQTNLNREDLTVTKTKTLRVEACPGKHKLSEPLAVTGKHGKK